MNRELEGDVNLVVEAGLKASEINTQRRAEIEYKEGYVDFPSYFPTTINSVELKNPRFAGFLVGIGRNYGPAMGERRQIPLSDTIPNSTIEPMAALYFRDKSGKSILREQEISDIADSFEGMSSTGETGLYFKAERKLETGEDGLNREMIIISDIKDFSDNTLDLSINIDLGFASQGDILANTLNSLASKAAADLQKDGGSLVSGPIILPGLNPIYMYIFDKEGKPFSQTDLDLTRKITQGVSLAVRLANTIMHKGDTTSVESINLKQMTTNEMIDLTENKHPDIAWLQELYGWPGVEEGY